ncbi:MAG: hypothetical protein KDA21_10725 [Phycisphaerales bacterium]|nr:hypothetical protein [Phycisphaerales bacterium]
MLLTLILIVCLTPLVGVVIVEVGCLGRRIDPRATCRGCRARLPTNPAPACPACAHPTPRPCLPARPWYLLISLGGVMAIGGFAIAGLTIISGLLILLVSTVFGGSSSGSPGFDLSLVPSMMGLAGLVLIGVGWRSRRLDRHPVCAACRYDLHGLPDRPKLCAECGSDLTLPRATRIGNRAHRPRLLTTGFLLFISGGMLLLLTASGHLTTPTWWLRSQVARGVDAHDGHIAGQLVDRIDRGTLPPSSILPIIDTLLKRQGDQDAAWHDEYAALIERCWAAGLLTPQQTDTFFRQAIEPGLRFEMRNRLRVGEPILLGLGQDPVFRVSQDFQFGMGTVDASLALRLKQIRVDGMALDFEPRWYRNAYNLAPRAGIRGGGDWLDLPIEEGWHMLALDFDVMIMPDGMTDPAAALHSWTYSWVHEVDAVGPGDPLVTTIDDPSLEAAILGSLRYGVGDVLIHAGYDALVRAPRPHFQQPPVALAFDMYYRFAGREVRVTSIVCRMGEGGPFSLYPKPGAVFPEADRIDLIFRANPALAEHIPGIEQVWGGEIVLKDVPVGNVPFESHAPERRAAAFADAFVVSGHGHAVLRRTDEEVTLRWHTELRITLPTAGAWEAIWLREDGSESAVGTLSGHRGDHTEISLKFKPVVPGERIHVVLRPIPERAEELGVTDEIWFTDPIPLQLQVP